MDLITNQISYKRMAASLGVAEQHEEFKPRGQRVRADVDVNVFTTNTIDFLNLVMLMHAKGMNSEIALKFMQSSSPPDFQEQLFNDLLGKRNHHLVQEIAARSSQSNNIIVPWGVAHMPGIAREIQKSGFRLIETKEYVAIRFHSAAAKNKNPVNEGDPVKPK